jgi:branched-chain amino acid transport system ATP-binding protein
MMLRLDQIHTFYGQIEALKGVSLEVYPGEIVTLIGANGAGKSTLLLTICGSPQASQGTVFFEGQDITHKPTHVIMQCGLALVPEGRRIFPGLTVRENLQMGGFFADKARLDTDLERVFALFPRLKERRDQRGGTLSGGEQQMLAIGRGLMSRPSLLLLDEPSLGLAPIIIAQIFQILREIREEGVTIFLVEQNAHRALQLADRGYVLENGRIVLADTGANLLANNEVRKAYLGG